MKIPAQGKQAVEMQAAEEKRKWIPKGPLGYFVKLFREKEARTREKRLSRRVYW